MSYFRDNVDRMEPYVPGEQPSPGSKVIKLNTNENPYPPSPKAMAVLRQFDGELLRRYSSPSAAALQHAAASVLNVPPEWIITGNGSDDLLAMVVLACAGPGRKVAYPMPTYVLYRTLAQMQDAPIAEIDYDDDYRLPTAELIAQQAAVTFIASPNSPSGTLVPNDEIEKLTRGLPGGVIVVDEAYADFAESSAIELVKRYGNVMVLRTFSKGYSLAGLRLGFGVMQPALADGINKVRDSYPVDAVACAVGAAAMADQEYKIACANRVKASRATLTRKLTELGFRVWPSEANFLLAQAPARTAEQGRELYRALKARGILVRYFDQDRLRDKLRITVGTDEQNAALVAALAEATKGG